MTLGTTPQAGTHRVGPDRADVLRRFEEYFLANFRKVIPPAQARAAAGAAGAATVFEEASLLRLWDDYIRVSAARLYDDVGRAARVIGDLSAIASGSILDVTAFPTTQLFRLLFPAARLSACDKHLEWQPFLDGVECRTCNLEKDLLPYADVSFDLVVFTETMEHIPRSPYELLGEIRRVMKPGAHLIFSVPNLSSFNNRLKQLAGMNTLSVELAYADTFGHFREYNMREVEHLFGRLGMRVLHREYTDYLPARSTGSLVRRARKAIQRVVTRPLVALDPSLRQVCFAVVRK